MPTSSIRHLLILLLVSLIGGCQLAGEKGSQTVTIEDLSLKSTARQNEQINKAIHLLEQGQQQAAEKLIDEVLVFNPRHVTANLLKDQLSLSFEELFGTSRLADYKIKSGDTLGQIADEWLKNPMYFVALAKLNQLKQPMKMHPGTRIKIPVITASPLAKKERQRSTANLNLLERYLKENRLFHGLEKSNQLFLVERDYDQLYQQQTKILDQLARSTTSITDRKKMISKVLKLAESSRNEKQESLYLQFARQQEWLLLIDEAGLLFKDESFVESAQKLVNANAIVSEQYIKVEEPPSAMQQQLIDRLHEQAVVLYRNHELKKALARWNLILQLEESHELAQKYTQRTHKLLSKLNQF